MSHPHRSAAAPGGLGPLFSGHPLRRNPRSFTLSNLVSSTDSAFVVPAITVLPLVSEKFSQCDFKCSLLSIAIPLPGFCNAGSVCTEMAIPKDGNVSGTDANEKGYRGFYLDLSKFADRQDFAVLYGTLRRQLDIVDSAGLSPQMLKFFRTIPILADETACLEKPLTEIACYGLANVRIAHLASSQSGIVKSLSGATQIL